jgi:glycosyltransferase involved in cell wall biosynthesis
MEPRAAGIEHDAARGPYEHLRDGAPWVAVLAQDVAEACTVACADGGQVGVFAWMLDDESRVVFDLGAGVECADQVIRLLARRGGKAERLVELPDLLDHGAAQEDRERDRPVPEVFASEHGGARRPPRLAAGDAVEVRETSGDALEQVRRIDAVIVRERNRVGLQPRDRRVSRARQTAGRRETLDAQRWVRRDDPAQPVVVVLVGEQHAELRMRLLVERREEAVELFDPVDCRDDEVESHSRTLTPVPLVSVLMSVHNDVRFVGEALQSMLRQTLKDLELIVVDDASIDGTSELLSEVDDKRLQVLRNDERRGLAASLNRGLDTAQGRYVVRLDSDDIATADRVERQVARIRDVPQVAVVGSAVVDLDERGERGRTHVMPAGARPLRWLALFSSPFFHPTVLVDRDQLERHGLRYDPDFLESEDYDLWTRLFAFADGDNLREPLVLKRVHPGQASQQRRDVQEAFQRRVALREIGRIAPEVDAEAAWRVGARRPGGSRREFLRLLRAFEDRYGGDWRVRSAAAWALIS